MKSDHVKKNGKDNHGLGKWSYLALQRGEGCVVTLIAVYKVCNGPIDPTKALPASTQQWTILNSKSKTIESILFLTVPHLILFINDLVKEKHEIITGIDANEPHARSRGDIARLWS